ncbi:MAG: penicillin-binding protein 1C [Halocynthiibacter sp.]|jgi:penicillin-binding protein 1C
MVHRALIGLVIALFLAAFGRDQADDWIARTELPALVQRHSQEVLARDGALLRAYPVADGRWRLQGALSSTDKRFIEMLIAYEDKRFYRHHGVDPIALMRAVGQAVQSGEIVSGGSTLTMQVARLLEEGPTGSWRGKLRQARVALALERKLSKAEILDLYLARAPYGGNIEGLRAASLAWFAKEPARLTPAQSALLIALPQSPAARRPDRHQEAAKSARDRVLSRLARSGTVSADEAQAALRDPIPTARYSFPKNAPHLADRLRREAPDAPRIQTSIDAALQAKVEALAANAARAYPDLTAALIIADHQSGAIRAYVGSAGYSDARLGYVDMAAAIRSPGSTLKPLIYGLAFDQGLAHPETVIEDRPTAFGSYAPQNFDGRFRGTIGLREALMQSLNIPAVALTQAIGPERLMAGLRRAGVEAQLPGSDAPGLAVALGGVGISLEDMVQLYAGIARGGESIALSPQPQTSTGSSARILSQESAWHIGNILAGIAPPAGAARNGLAYKTGTSYGHRDAWAIGFDGQHVIGVWLGRADGTPVPGVFGGELAAPVLFDAFARLKPKTEPLTPPPPATLIASNAMLPTPLQHFRPRDALFAAPLDAPKLAFPPNGAILAAAPRLIAKVEKGRPPFIWLLNGAAIQSASYERQAELPWPGSGFSTLAVIDADGRAARARFELE